MDNRHTAPLSLVFDLPPLAKSRIGDGADETAALDHPRDSQVFEDDDLKGAPQSVGQFTEHRLTPLTDLQIPPGHLELGFRSASPAVLFARIALQV